MPDSMAYNVNSKGVILFVHGFGSSHNCWSRLLDLLNADNRVTSQYEFRTWDYPTSWFQLNVLGRIPRLKEVSHSLGDEIDSPPYRGRELTLVGHSLGGLIVESYIAGLLQAGKADTLRQLQQVFLFATPNAGSTTASMLRRILYTVFKNPQERALRVLDPEVADLQAVIRERIVNTELDSSTARRIPVHAFCGLQDDVVPEASARGSFDDVRCIKGDHFSIIQPSGYDDPRYTEFVELLLDPGGHAHLYDIDRFEMTVKVEPHESGSITTNTTTPRRVDFDNHAVVTRSVRFAASNRNIEPFTLMYKTRNFGYVVGHTSHPNEVDASERGSIEDTGTAFQFDFTPRPGDEFKMTVDVYKGFDAGHRDIHYHLGRDSEYRSVVCKLDLSGYLGARYIVSQPPRCYVHPEDPGHGDMCAQRGARTRLEPTVASPAGLYEWEIRNVRQAVVDIIWDVAKTDHPSVAMLRHRPQYGSK